MALRPPITNDGRRESCVQDRKGLLACEVMPVREIPPDLDHALILSAIVYVYGDRFFPSIPAKPTAHTEWQFGQVTTSTHDLFTR